MSRFFFILLTAFIAYSSNSLANSTNYLVENVHVNVIAKSPSAARNKAVFTARKNAFEILLTRLELDPAIIEQFEKQDFSDMVRSEQIDQERIAGNNYSATFNILFGKDFVEHILNSKNINKAAKPAQEINLLIPAKLVDDRIILWEDNNDWKATMANIINKISDDKPRQFLIPEADIENLTTLNSENVQILDYAGIEPLLIRYNAQAAYVALFFYDEVRNKVTIDVLNIQKFQKKKVRLSFVNINHLNYNSLLGKVADKTIDYLESSASYAQSKRKHPDLIQMQIPIDSLNEWLVIKKRIETSGLVNEMLLESVSRDYALISVKYKHPKQTIVESFKSAGLTLNKKDHDLYILTPN